MGKRVFVSGIVILFMMVGIISLEAPAAQSASGGEIKIDFSCTAAPGSVLDLATVEFKTIVEKRSRGRISVTLYRHGALYDPKGEIEAIAKAGLAMAILSMSHVGGRSPALEFIGGLGAQGCWSDRDHYWRFTDLPETRRIARSEFEAKINAKLLSLLSYGPGIIGNSRRPIHTVEDYKGLKVRAAGSAQASLYKALGMVPTELSAKEVYMALQRGTIDGASSGPERFFKSKWYEVTKYLTQDDAVPGVSMWLAINLDFWDKLSQQDQLILAETARDLEKWTRTYSIKETEEAYEKLRPLVKDFYFFPKSEVAKINEIAGPTMHNLIVKRAGKEMGDELWTLLLNAKSSR